MARPTKQGLDYFPIDCHFDEKIELYLLEKESDGLSVLVTIWQLIYQNEGYYIDNNNDLPLLIKKRISVDINTIKECINACLSRNIFDNKTHKKHGILTSGGIQKRYFEAAKRKKIVYYNINYLINGVTVCEKAVNVVHQSTKEDVEEEVKVKEEYYSQSFISFWLLYPSRNGKKLEKGVCLKMFMDLNKDDLPKILEAVKNYSISSQIQAGIGIKDPKRFIRNGFWKEWLVPESVASEKEPQLTDYEIAMKGEK